MSFVDQGIDFAFITSVVVELLLYMERSSLLWRSRTTKLVTAALAATILLTGVLVASLKFVGFTHGEVWNDRLNLFSSLTLCTFLLVLGRAGSRFGAKDLEVKEIGTGLSVWAVVALAVDICDMNAKWSQVTLFDTIANTFWDAMILYWAYTIWHARRSNYQAIPL